MRIIVCVKQVPDGQLRLEPGSKRLERAGSGELNKVDLNAIEEALRRKDEDDAEVVAVSMGPESVSDGLRTALALGANRAVLVSDPAAGGSDLVATSAVLAAAVRREQPDLVLFGQQASDGGGAVLWAAVAERLGLPCISQATALRDGDGIVSVTRQTEFGDDVIEAPLPAVVSVSDAINEPRYASLRGMMGAKKKPLEVLSLADLGIDVSQAGEAGSRTTVIGVSEPPVRGNSLRVDDDDGAAAQVIFDFLVDRQLV